MKRNDLRLGLCLQMKGSSKNFKGPKIRLKIQDCIKGTFPHALSLVSLGLDINDRLGFRISEAGFFAALATSPEYFFHFDCLFESAFSVLCKYFLSQFFSWHFANQTDVNPYFCVSKLGLAFIKRRKMAKLQTRPNRPGWPDRDLPAGEGLDWNKWRQKWSKQKKKIQTTTRKRLMRNTKKLQLDQDLCAKKQKGISDLYTDIKLPPFPVSTGFYEPVHSGTWPCQPFHVHWRVAFPVRVYPGLQE